MNPRDPLAPGIPHSCEFRRRTVRAHDHLVYEAANGRNYRIALARLRSHGDVLRVVQWLVNQEGVTLGSIGTLIRVA